MNLFVFGLSKAETGGKTAPRVPKLGYADVRVPKLSFRVALATSGAGVVYHIHINVKSNCLCLISYIKMYMAKLFEVFVPR